MDKQILENIHNLKRQLLPNDHLIIFGSQARGDAYPDSDWDMLVIVNSDSINLDDEVKYSYPFTKLGWKHIEQMINNEDNKNSI